MSGLACYDFGDTIRFAACTAGYLSETAGILTQAEKDSLATGAAVITLELASRFLGDYLEGDKYFRIDYPEQNLSRARAQLVLFQDMMAHMEEMKAILRELSGNE
jgi:hypothetical protein